MLSSYSENEMIALAGKWFRDIRAKQEKIRIKGAHGWKWSEQWERDYLHELKREEWQEVLGLNQEEMHDGMTTTREFLENEGVSYDRTSEAFNRLLSCVHCLVA